VAQVSDSPYHYERSLKSRYADEPINTYLLRPTAGVLVSLLYRSSITPNQLTIAAIFAGMAAAYCYSLGQPMATILAGLLVTLKDILDSADGQLARAKNLYSRRGRFLDSIGDFLVDVLIFGAITVTLYRVYPLAGTILLGVAGLLGITLRVSYHVFYYVSFLHLEDRYLTNRLIEEIRDEDRRGDPVALRLQKIFVAIYGWQDKLMARIDDWSKSRARSLGENEHERFRQRWYADRIGLLVSGFLGFGTELALLTICSLLDQLRLYLWLNLLLMNGIWLLAIFYRKIILAPRTARLVLTQVNN